MPNLLKGVVTKTGVMNKTCTVTIARTFEHPKLLKKMHRTKKMLVHDEGETAKVGDLVTIMHGKPLSARKHFTLQSIDHRPEHSAPPSSAVLVALGDMNRNLVQRLQRGRRERDAQEKQ